MNTNASLSPPSQASADSSQVNSELTTLKAELTALKAQNRSLRASERESNKKIESEAMKVCTLSSVISKYFVFVRGGIVSLSFHCLHGLGTSALYPAKPTAKDMAYSVVSE